jgi:carbon-monoxide dehydrogenase small subunit
MILSAFALLVDNPLPTEEDIKESIAGNLCRCTGYKQIIEAIQKTAKTLKEKQEQNLGKFRELSSVIEH